MSQPYEYTLLVKYLTPVSMARVPNYRDERDQQTLSLELMKFTKEQLPNVLSVLKPAGGWQVNSHSLTFSDDTAILTILCQRPTTR